MSSKITITYFLIFFIIVIGNAQSLTGTNGLVKSPTARFFEDKTIVFGASFIPPGYFKRTYGFQQGRVTGNAGLNTFITLNFLPFAEIMFRYTHELNVKVTPISRYFPDRMLSLRLKLLNEAKFKPNLVLGLHDITGLLSVKGTNPNFTSSYIVASKSVLNRNINLDLSVGYGFEQRGITPKEFNGLFGGVELGYNKLPQIKFLMDYDAENLNIGIRGLTFNRITTMINYYPKYSKIGYLLGYKYKL